MKRIVLALSCCLLAGTALRAQISIDATDMPVVGDMLRYSVSLPSASINLSNTGAGVAWDFSTLTPVYQQVDTYKTAAAAGYSGGGIPPTAFGYKVFDTLTFPGAPISATNVYTFFNVKASPSRFVAEGFGAMITVLTVAGGYSNEDTIYNFPLTYNRLDSSTFKLTINVPLVGTLKQQGSRKTFVDGWGTISTPYTSSPVQVIRVRSEVNEVDTLTFGTQTIPVPRHYAEYKWLAKGEHYPMLIVTANIVGSNEVPTSVRYRDMARNLSVGQSSARLQALEVYPNPATAAELQVRIPASWTHYSLQVYDASGKLLSQSANTPGVQISALPAGHYYLIAESNGVYGTAQFVKP